MKKFEEYDFYSENKDFLASEGIITFTDADGRLLALKPDVTLSILKNFKEEKGCVKRLYYNENVYRISETSHTYQAVSYTHLDVYKRQGFHRSLMQNFWKRQSSTTCNMQQGRKREKVGRFCKRQQFSCLLYTSGSRVKRYLDAAPTKPPMPTIRQFNMRGTSFGR